MNESFSRTRRALLAASPALLAPRAFAQGFPARPIVLICPFSACGTADVQLRVLAAAAGKELGQPMIVENRPGAAGTLGPSTLLGAAPDGYTLSMVTGIALLR